VPDATLSHKQSCLSNNHTVRISIGAQRPSTSAWQWCPLHDYWLYAGLLVSPIRKITCELGTKISKTTFR